MHHLGIIWSAMTAIPDGLNLLTRDLQHQVFHGKPQIANHKMSRDHGLAVAFAAVLESMNYSCCLGNKSDALRLDKKQHDGTKQ